jgi:hypothetical protein
MPEPKLTREVELPRPSSNGAAVVAIASAAMFMAVGASAFVVRVRMQRDLAFPRVMADAAAERMTTDPSPPPPAESYRIGFMNALYHGDDELALEWYSNLPDTSEASLQLRPARDLIAARFLKDQLVRLASDLEQNDCASVDSRLAKLHRLTPEVNLPLQMAKCSVLVDK